MYYIENVYLYYYAIGLSISHYVIKASNFLSKSLEYCGKVLEIDISNWYNIQLSLNGRATFVIMFILTRSIIAII